MYKKRWANLRRVNEDFELSPEPTKRTECSTRVNFTHVSFDCSEEHVAAVDTTGHLYFIDLSNNSPCYQKLGSIGRATFLAFNPINKLEILVGLVTTDIKILRVNVNVSQFCLLIAHKYPPLHFSFYKKYCLTSSSREVIIWCLDSCSKAHQLKVNTKNVIIKKASFSNQGHIVVLYYNDSMQVWNFNQLGNDVRIDPKIYDVRNIKDFVFTKNGRAMIIASAQNKIVILNTCNWSLIKTLTLPDNYTGIRCFSLVPSPLDGGANNIVACVSSSCNLNFFDLNEACFIHTLQPVKPIRKIAVSPTGRYIAYIEKEGNLKLLITESLFPKKCESEKKLKEPCRPVAHKVREHLNCVRKYIKQELRSERLMLILKEFGEYPEKYRVLIWSTVLQLPGNKTAYNALANRSASTHCPSDILKDYPLASRSKRTLLTTTVHCLIQWCPLLVQCTFLPNLIFPFLVIFQKDQLLGFELTLSILLNYCQKWFEYHPLPPLNVLGIIENILLQADPALLKVFCERGITSSEYAWPLLRTAMSEVLSSSEWLILWDHLISFKKPLLLLMCVVSYSICSREIIISSLHSEESINRYFTRQGHVGAQELLKLAQQLDSDIPLRVHPSQYLRNDIIELPSTGPYPPFVTEDFPKFLTDEISPIELEKLKEKKRIMHGHNREALIVEETTRLKHEAKAFMDQIHQTRLEEAERCFKEQFSDTNWELTAMGDRLGQVEVDPENVHTSDRFHDVPRLNLSSSDEDVVDLNEDRTKWLQRNVDTLEYEVQSLLNSLRSQKSRHN